jgi:hypothetical protein
MVSSSYSSYPTRHEAKIWWRWSLCFLPRLEVTRWQKHGVEGDGAETQNAKIGFVVREVCFSIVLPQTS